MTTTRQKPRKSTTPTSNRPHRNGPAGSGNFPPGQQKPHTSKNEESMSKRTHPTAGHHPRTHQLLPRVRAVRRRLGQCPKCGTVIYTPRLTRHKKAPPPHTHGMVGLPHAPTSNRHREPNRSRICRPATPDHDPGAVDTHPPPGTLSLRPRIFTSSPRTPPPTVLP